MNFIYLLLCISICSQTLFAAQQKNTHPRDEEAQRSNQRRKLETASQETTMEDSDSSSESFMSDEETDALAQQLVAERNSPTLFASLQTNAVGNINAPAHQNTTTTTSSSVQPMQDIDEKSHSDNESQSSDDSQILNDDDPYFHLMSAARRGDIPTIYKLVKEQKTPLDTDKKIQHESYDDINFYDTDEWYNSTPLMVAASHGQVNAIKALVGLGAKVNFKDKLGTALHRAVINQEVDAIIALGKLGANLEATEDTYGYTPLILAADFGYVDGIKALANLGANLEARDYAGYTALGEAVYSFRPEAVATLLNLGAGINALQGDRGVSILRTLWHPNRMAYANYEFNEANEAQKTAAAQILELLLRKGARPDKAFWKEIQRYPFLFKVPFLLKIMEEHNKEEKNKIQQRVAQSVGEGGDVRDVSGIIASYAYEPIVNPNAQEKAKVSEENDSEKKESSAQTTTSTITPAPAQRALSEIEKEQTRVNYLLINGIKHGATVADVNNWLNMHAQLGAQDAEGFTPLMLAILYNRNDIFDFLLGQISRQPHPRGYLDMTDNSGFTALSWALQRKKNDLFMKLLHAGASNTNNNNMDVS